VAGVLLLGFEPTAWIKGAYVQFLRIDGTELTDPIIDRKELTGPLPGVFRQMDDITKAHIRVGVSVADSQVETRSPDDPISAVQQLLRNAVIHRVDSSNECGTWKPVGEGL
jgi:ATP-dependent DNA helicase RecG